MTPYGDIARAFVKLVGIALIPLIPLIYFLISRFDQFGDTSGGKRALFWFAVVSGLLAAMAAYAFWRERRRSYGKALEFSCIRCGHTQKLPTHTGSVNPAETRCKRCGEKMIPILKTIPAETLQEKDERRTA